MARGPAPLPSRARRCLWSTGRERRLTQSHATAATSSTAAAPRVLLERDAENTLTIHQQKRKLSQQHDVLAALKQK